MKLFIYEHITSGALSEQALPNSLANEGNAMLAAVLRDCADIDYLTLNTLRDHRLTTSALFDREPRHLCHTVRNASDYAQYWQQCLKNCDAVLIIAPETDDILADLQQQALNQGKRIMGCQPKAIRLTSNKYRCYQHLSKHGLPTVETMLAEHWPNHRFVSPSGYILKPLHGAGCIDTYSFKTAEALERSLSNYDITTLKQAVIQPYLEGRAASLSLLASDNEIEVLAINQQHIIQSQHQLKLAGCTINTTDAIPFSFEQAEQLASTIHAAIPGLWGHLGVDIILTENAAFVIDINPRLTSSYIALRRSLGLNPMSRLLNMAQHGLKALPKLSQRKAVELTL